MVAPAYPLINGHAYDHASAEIEVNGTIIIGIKEIGWSQSLEGAALRGTHAQVLARTRGEYDAEANLVMYMREYSELIESLTGGDASVGYGEQSFSIVVTFSEANQPIQVVRLLGCRIKGEESGTSQGTDPTEDSIDLTVLQIERNGKRMVSNALI